MPLWLRKEIQSVSWQSFMNVAIAIIINQSQHVLITQRALQDSHGGFWEFPGGKLKSSETGPEALIREIKEEVGLDVLAYEYLGLIEHTYNHVAVSLMVYQVTDYRGEATPLESQMALQWVPLETLSSLKFPAANSQIIRLIKEPSHLPSLPQK